MKIMFEQFYLIHLKTLELIYQLRINLNFFFFLLKPIKALQC